MIRRVVWLSALSALAAGVAACPPIDEGGGGGFGISNFTQGFIFVRADDRNVYASDKSSGYTEVAQLTRNGNNKHPSISRDGQLVVFVNGSGAGASIQTALLAGSETPSTILAADADRANFQNPVFSPDGQRIAFAYEKGGASYVGVVDIDGQNFQSFGSGTLSYTSPSFISDDKLLVAAGSLATGYNQIERIDLTAATTENITNTLGNEATAIRNRLVVSPDGTRAAFDGVLGSGATRIFAVNLSTGAVTQLTDYPAEPNANDTFPTWVSQTEIAFSSDTGGNDQVYVIPADAMKQSGTLRLPSAVEPWFGP